MEVKKVWVKENSPQVYVETERGEVLMVPILYSNIQFMSEDSLQNCKATPVGFQWGSGEFVSYNEFFYVDPKQSVFYCPDLISSQNVRLVADYLQIPFDRLSRYMRDDFCCCPYPEDREKLENESVCIEEVLVKVLGEDRSKWFVIEYLR